MTSSPPLTPPLLLDLVCNEVLPDSPPPIYAPVRSVSPQLIRMGPLASPYDPIFDWFLCEGFEKPRIIGVYPKNLCLIIAMHGKCPVHNKRHSSNNFYILWYYRTLGNRCTDFLSCHHGNEKCNRMLLATRLPLEHLKQ